MESPERYRSTLAFVDLLFNILLGFVFLFIVAFILINPVAKHADIIVPAEYMIVMTWPAHSDNDLDLWVRDPQGNRVGYRSREGGVMHLDRDDLGSRGDRITAPAGTPAHVIALNREVVTLRGTMPGEYVISVHFYMDRDTQYPVPVTVEVIKINPYQIVYNQTQNFTAQGQELPFMQFSVDSDGHYRDVYAGGQLAGALKP